MIVVLGGDVVGAVVIGATAAVPVAKLVISPTSTGTSRRGSPGFRCLEKEFRTTPRFAFESSGPRSLEKVRRPLPVLRDSCSTGQHCIPLVFVVLGSDVVRGVVMGATTVMVAVTGSVDDDGAPTFDSCLTWFKIRWANIWRHTMVS